MFLLAVRSESSERLESAEEKVAQNKHFAQLIGENLDVLPLKLRDIEYEVLLFLLRRERGAFAVRGIQTGIFSAYITEGLYEAERKASTQNVSQSEERGVKAALTPELEKGLKEAGYVKPSYDKILNALKSLAGLGLVAERAEGRRGAKAKTLWTLDANFYLVYLKRRREIIDELRDEKNADLVYSLYPQVVMEFYGIPVGKIGSAHYKKELESRRKEWRELTKR